MYIDTYIHIRTYIHTYIHTSGQISATENLTQQYASFLFLHLNRSCTECDACVFWCFW